MTAGSLFIILYQANYPFWDLLDLDSEMPHDWVLRIFGFSIVAFVLYFLYMGALALLHRSGAFSSAQRWCRGRGAFKQHKRLRRDWKRQFGVAAGGQTKRNPLVKSAKPLPQDSDHVALVSMSNGHGNGNVSDWIAEAQHLPLPQMSPLVGPPESIP